VKLSEFSFKLMWTAGVIAVALGVTTMLTLKPDGTSLFVPFVFLAVVVGAGALVVGLIASIWDR
jgi:hypothetical protein